jgi:glucose-6-phosphate isomerase
MTHVYRPAADLLEQFLETRLVTRIWDRDVTVWGVSPGSTSAQSIANRLGWLDVSEVMPTELPQLRSVAREAAARGIRAVYLLGMGGSSLCAEVIRSVFGVGEGQPDVFVLDTTDEGTMASAAARLDPAATWFIVASKSGSTIEVSSLEGFFWSQMQAALGEAAGHQFIAITDAGTALERLAGSRRYRHIFINPPDVGGRFSALSLFGLVPAALLGAPLQTLLEGCGSMAEGCRQENPTNAGLELGSFMGAAALSGRDKLTVVLPPSLHSLSVWIEQLVAESTGKDGKGLLPVVDEPLGRPDQYGNDRAFVVFATDRDAPDHQAVKALEHAGHPVHHLSTRLDGLGAEFFRWEFATAVAGAALSVNPFDEPNVAEAKEQTRMLITAFETEGRLPAPTPAASSDAVITSSPDFSGSSPEAVVAAALASLQPYDYVAFLSYLSPSAKIETTIATIRQAIRSRFRVATTFGVGPRYLHSTGQYHKGGPNTLLAFILIADDEIETQIPETGYSFSVLKRAQALGDAQTLETHLRRTVLLQFKTPVVDTARAIETLFAAATEASPE